MNSTSLPSDLLETAIYSGQEVGWKIELFPAVLKRAAAHGLACIGGQFQWVFPDGTCEAYWLNADAPTHLAGETWSAFVTRSEQQVSEGFSRLVSTVNFDTEAENWEFLKTKREQGIILSDHLLFVAYFNSQEEMSNE